MLLGVGGDPTTGEEAKENGRRLCDSVIILINNIGPKQKKVC